MEKCALVYFVYLETYWYVMDIVKTFIKRLKHLASVNEIRNQ